MVFMSIHELVAKYNLNPAQKEQVKQAVNHNNIRYRVDQKSVDLVTGKDFPLHDTKVAILKYDEEDVKKLLGI